MKNAILLFIILIVFCFGISCSTARKYRQAPDISSLTKDKVYQLRVRTGNLALDRLIYDVSYITFGSHLPLSDKGPYTGYIDIVYDSESHSLFRPSVSGSVANMSYGSSWYTGDASLRADSNYVDHEILSDGTFTWQNSKIAVAIRDLEYRKLWAAEVKYRGGTHFSGFTVKTSDDAALYCLDRIMEQFEKDYIIPVTAESGKRKSVPEVALMLRTKNIAVAENTSDSSNVKTPEVALIVKTSASVVPVSAPLESKGYLDR